tara:strand:- start:6334 stop:7101 length:768 start_codon:yes stop_codon:yes gene_type:complete
MSRFSPELSQHSLKNFFRSVGALVVRDVKVRDSDIILGLIVTFLKPLFFLAVIVGAVTLGLRGVQAESTAISFLFPLLFWFYFNDAAMKVNLLDSQEQLKALPNIQPLSMMLAVVLSEFVINSILLAFIFITLIFFEISVDFFFTTILFLLTTLFTFAYVFFVSLIVYKNQVLVKFHDVFLRILFFTSSVVVPLSILPQNVQSFLYINPLCHIMDLSRVYNLELTNSLTSFSYVMWSIFIMVVFGFVLYRYRLQK